MVGFSCGIAARLKGWIDENNGVRLTDDVAEGLGLAVLGFDRVQPQVTGRPSYHDCVLLKLCIYGRAK